MELSPNERKLVNRVRPSQLPKVYSSLTQVFSPLQGGWRAYIDYIRNVAKDGDEDMKKIINKFDSTPRHERNSLTPELLCEMAGVKVTDMLAAILPKMWIYSNAFTSISAAALNPAILLKTGKSALGNSRNSVKDREMFLRITGMIPTSKGSTTNINNLNAPVAVSSSKSAHIGHLPSAGSDMVELDSVDADPGYSYQLGTDTEPDDVDSTSD